MELHEEFQICKQAILYKHTIRKIEEYLATVNEVDIPEFAKCENDKVNHQAADFVDKATRIGDLNRILLQIM